MVVISWSDHRANRRGAGFSSGTSPKSSAPCNRVTVVGAERSIRQSCGRIRADAAERRSSANNIIANLGQKCNPKNQHGRKTLQKISTEGKPAQQGTRAQKQPPRSANRAGQPCSTLRRGTGGGLRPGAADGIIQCRHCTFCPAAGPCVPGAAGRGSAVQGTRTERSTLR